MLSGKLIQQLFDCVWPKPYPLSWVSGRSTVCVSSESAGFTGFPLPQAGRRGCWLHILIPLSLFLHPSIPLCPVYSLQPCGCATSETLQTTKVLAVASDWPVMALTMGTTGRGAGVGGGVVLTVAWWWDFFMLWSRQEGEGMITCGQALTFKIYGDAVALCGQVTSCRTPPLKTIKPSWGRNVLLLWLSGKI